MGTGGAVTVAYNGLAARAGLEALKQGGSAVDAAMTTALTQIALTAGAPVSYFGIQSLVYYEAKTEKIYTMNAEWNTVANERDPLSIPGGLDLSSEAGRRGSGAPSGRTALVGGFMKGVEAAHRRFGRLPFASLFDPAIFIAEDGMPVSRELADQFRFRHDDLARLPDTRATFLKPDGSAYQAGEIFKQPALAETLRRVASVGSDYMYGGPWGRKLVRAVRANGGKMTLEDLQRYEAIWADPISASLAGGYSVFTNPWPNSGGTALIEAQNLAVVSGLADGPHWTSDGDALRKVLDICNMGYVSELPAAVVAAAFPGLDMSPDARITMKHAEALWARIKSGTQLVPFAKNTVRHSDDVVAIDKDGNIAAITLSINSVIWGKTCIVIDGITIGDPGSFQQQAIAATGPGKRLPAITETGILMKGGHPVIGFASMGAGLHLRTFQCLQNVTAFGMNVEQAINTADLFAPGLDLKTMQQTVHVPQGRFNPLVLDATGYSWKELPMSEARPGGEGKWVAISRNPDTGLLHAASHNRSNSDAVAF
ncbi:gamma-glutamyltranspeptidase/glutathione hydrolase [Sphingosinicella microcystinivorans]|nr:gamma-glutamyltranspeptidase/glutathione hydrolase [Sphingosinicella microcystinivorans]